MFEGWDLWAPVSSNQLRSHWRSWWDVSYHFYNLKMVFLHFFMLLCSLIMLSQILVHRCVIRGCVPKKILVYGASFRGEIEVRPWSLSTLWKIYNWMIILWKILFYARFLCDYLGTSRDLLVNYKRFKNVWSFYGINIFK